MRIGLDGVGANLETVRTCRRLGIDQVCLWLGDVSHGIDLNVIRSARAFLAGEGIDGSCAHLGFLPSAGVIAGQADATAELERVRRAIDGFGAAGYYAVRNFIDCPRPASENEEREYWGRVLAYYGTLVHIAEQAGVRIALHAFYFQDRLVRGVAELARIVNAFPSACNGVLYCGGLHIPGDDVADSVRTFQGRIFLAHARDVKGSRFLKESDCVEVPLGEGDVNLAGMIAALQAAGYQGMICPEHLGPPRSPGEDQLGIAVRHLRDFLTRR